MAGLHGPEDVGYFSVGEMQALARGVSGEGETGGIYLSIGELAGLQSGTAAYLSVETMQRLAQGGKGTVEDVYMAVGQAPRDAGYHDVDGEAGAGLYMTVESARRLVDGGYLETETLRRLACGDGGYMAVDAVRGIVGDAGYMDLCRVEDAGYTDVELSGEGLYMELPERLTGVYQDLPKDPEFRTISFNGILSVEMLRKLEKLRRRRQKQAELDRLQGQRDREELAQRKLREENLTKRMTHKEKVKHEKQLAKEEKQRSAREKKEAKRREKEQLKAVQRRMSASKKRLKAGLKDKAQKSKLIEQDELAAERQSMTQLLKAAASASLALDDEEILALWRAEPEESRYVAVAPHRPGGEGYLPFEAKELLIVSSKGEDGFLLGRSIRSGRQGLFPAALAAHTPHAAPTP